MNERFVYTGRELEAMSLAVNYHRWIFESMKPHLGKRLVEVGAGQGSFSEMLLECDAERLALLEPSRSMYEQLKARVSHLKTNATVETYNATFREVSEEIRASQEPDSILYINVLEHIEDDEAELALAHRTLCERGRVFIFVPAFKWLYGKFDEEVGHVRRYSKRELEDKCRHARFKIIKSTYFDFLGLFPWYVKYRILKSSSIEPWAVQLYDRYLLHVTKAIESTVRPPIGKNIVLVAEKV
ncbi:MAG: methyltransferase domain-containing protein [Pyrinomonadaceae bacterium]|nr:methyltransferase domain-containing protein [Pyrinomonadaceae bacterium]